MDTELEELKSALRSSSHAIFFGGAGMSTASGIPDFRGQAGLYSTSAEDEPEYLLSDTCLKREPERFFAYYRSSILHPEAKPNAGHYALAELEKQGILHAVITQNIDGLHQAAGSGRVLELHGSVARTYCMKCMRPVESCVITETAGIPRCETCGGIVRPDVVLYGEFLPHDVFEQAQEEIEKADLLIVGGSSLTVQPAASLVERFIRKKSPHFLAILNKSATYYDSAAEVIIREPLEKVLPELI